MKITKHRFFLDGSANRQIERIDWVLAGTEGVDRYDPRCAPIGQMVNGIDLWMPVLIDGPAFDMTPLLPTYNYKNETIQDPETGNFSVVQVPESVQSYNQMDVYSQPLLPGYVEITMAQYNAA